jgi:hypothetical protein
MNVACLGKAPPVCARHHTDKRGLTQVSSYTFHALRCEERPKKPETGERSLLKTKDQTKNRNQQHFYYVIAIRAFG